MTSQLALTNQPEKAVTVPYAPSPQQLLFLERVSFGDTDYEASAYAEVDRLEVERWKKSKNFSERYNLARQDSADLLEKEARRRAVHGVIKSVWFKGEECGEETHYSDSLLMFLLKGRRADVFGDRVDINANINTSIVAVLRSLPDMRAAIEGQAKVIKDDDGSPV